MLFNLAHRGAGESNGSWAANHAMSLWDIGRLVAIACGAGMSFGFLTSDHHAQWADWIATLTGIASGAASLPFSNRLVQRVETGAAI